MRFIVVIFSVLILGISVLAPHAAEFGTRDEAVAMLKRVQEKFKKDGPEATFKAINTKASGFADRDLYPFVTELTGLCRQWRHSRGQGQESHRSQGSGRKVHDPGIH